MTRKCKSSYMAMSFGLSLAGLSGMGCGAESLGETEYSDGFSEALVAGDECDTTAGCRAIYPDATDCLGSKSDTSVCMCGDVRCADEPEPPPPPPKPGSCSVRGSKRKWHRVEVLCDGPQASESSEKTFTDYRMTVEFKNGNRTVKVPGHFAANGNAANSGSSSGSKWRAYFMPTATGTWSYKVSMVSGNDVAINDAKGSTVGGINGRSGSFSVTGSNAPISDMRRQGRLVQRSGERYLRFEGTGDYFIDAGANSPENLLGFKDFDNTQKSSGGSCKGILHSFQPHVKDWKSGDPTWKSGKGKGLVGLVNYLSGLDVNAMYFVAMSVNGDGCDSFPWTSYSGSRFKFDVSKLDQWEIVFGHMQRKGVMIHYVTQETENDQMLGGLTRQRKLYYREIVSRFAHHPALQWNLGEENTNTPNEVRSFANYIRGVDPYNHPLVLHTYPSQKEERYAPLLGFGNLNGPTLQFGGIPSSGSGTLYNVTREWIERSADAGRQWVVTATEASGNDAPTPNTGVTEKQRVHWMWGNVMAGGGGIEWYLKNNGVGHAYDLAVENLREFDAHWKQTGHLGRFFREIVQQQKGVNLQNLEPANGLSSNGSDWVLADEGRAYIIFLRKGGSTSLTLPGNGSYSVQWFNPRSGKLFNRASVSGSGSKSLGGPPEQTGQDWVILVSK